MGSNWKAGHQALGKNRDLGTASGETLAYLALIRM